MCGWCADWWCTGLGVWLFLRVLIVACGDLGLGCLVHYTFCLDSVCRVDFALGGG